MLVNGIDQEERWFKQKCFCAPSRGISKRDANRGSLGGCNLKKGALGRGHIARYQPIFSIELHDKTLFQILQIVCTMRAKNVHDIMIVTCSNSDFSHIFF